MNQQNICEDTNGENAKKVKSTQSKHPPTNRSNLLSLLTVSIPPHAE